MNPTISSASSLLVAAFGALLGIAASNGIIPQGDVSTDAAILATAAGLIGTAALTWWKAKHTTQEAKIKDVNATNNGVVVVKATDASAAGILPVNAPLIGGK